MITKPHLRDSELLAAIKTSGSITTELSQHFKLQPNTVRARIQRLVVEGYVSKCFESGSSGIANNGGSRVRYYRTSKPFTLVENVEKQDWKSEYNSRLPRLTKFPEFNINQWTPKHD